MIRRAAREDLNSIMEIIDATVEEMNQQGNYQWDKNYPKVKDFARDIDDESLYVQDVDGQIYGIICVNEVETVEYESLYWSSKASAMVIHRMAVNPMFRRQGVAIQLIQFVEKLAKERGIHYLKTDTNSVNIKMNALFQKCGFRFIGEVQFQGKETPFYCYDKEI